MNNHMSRVANGVLDTAELMSCFLQMLVPTSIANIMILTH